MPLAASKLPTGARQHWQFPVLARAKRRNGQANDVSVRDRAADWSQVSGELNNTGTYIISLLAFAVSI